MSPQQQSNSDNPKWFAPVSVATGIIFLISILIAAVFIPEPTPFQTFVFRVVMAISAAAFGATIPGFLKLNLPFWGQGTLAAGGALAMFAIIFNINPPTLESEAWTDPDPNPDRQINLDVSSHIAIDLPDCESTNTDMEGFIFDNGKLTNCKFDDSSLSRARFKDANVSGASFQRVEAYGVSFENGGVVGANFTSAILVGVNFRNAELYESHFWGANLIRADFRDADLRGVQFAQSDISGADFRNTLNLTQEQINSAFYDPSFEKPLRLPDGYSVPPSNMERSYTEALD